MPAGPFLYAGGWVGRHWVCLHAAGQQGVRRLLTSITAAGPSHPVTFATSTLPSPDQLHAVLTRRSKQNGFKEMVM